MDVFCYTVALTAITKAETVVFQLRAVQKTQLFAMLQYIAQSCGQLFLNVGRIKVTVHRVTHPWM
jgi:hypothetical protein